MSLFEELRRRPARKCFEAFYPKLKSAITEWRCGDPILDSSQPCSISVRPPKLLFHQRTSSLQIISSCSSTLSKDAFLCCRGSDFCSPQRLSWSLTLYGLVVTDRKLKVVAPSKTYLLILMCPEYHFALIEEKTDPIWQRSPQDNALVRTYSGQLEVPPSNNFVAPGFQREDARWRFHAFGSAGRTQHVASRGDAARSQRLAGTREQHRIGRGDDFWTAASQKSRLRSTSS